MYSNIHAVLFGVLGLSLLTGCVSTGKYKKLETDKNQQISQLQGQVSSLEQEKSAIAAEKEALAKASAQTQTQYNELVSQLSDELQKGQLKVTQYQNMLTVDVAEKIFFASGSAMLKEGGKEVLRKLASALRSYADKYIRVVGHTDNVPVSKGTQATYPTNWELSAIRATNVVRFLQDAGVPPERLIISGRGEYAPVAPNDTPENKQRNRRIEIMLLDKNLAESVQAK